MPEYTPEHIAALVPNEVFVFGSNAQGLHYGGAARFAYDNFGAEWGVGDGHTGQSYAINTMGSVQDLEDGIENFHAYSKRHPELRFLVTPLGTGIAGRPVKEVASFFVGSYPNVVLPEIFWAAGAWVQTEDGGLPYDRP